MIPFEVPNPLTSPIAAGDSALAAQLGVLPFFLQQPGVPNIAQLLYVPMPQPSAPGQPGNPVKSNKLNAKSPMFRLGGDEPGESSKLGAPTTTEYLVEADLIMEQQLETNIKNDPSFPQDRTLFVGSLPPDVTGPELEQFFHFSVGERVKAKVILDWVSLKSKQCALIRCASQEACQKILAKPRIFHDRTLRIEWSNPDMKGTKKLDFNILFVGNLHESVTEETVKSYFEKYGEILHIRFFKNKSTIPGYKNSFLNFTNEEAIVRIISMPTHHVIGGSIVNVALYRPNTKAYKIAENKGNFDKSTMNHVQEVQNQLSELHKEQQSRVQSYRNNSKNSPELPKESAYQSEPFSSLNLDESNSVLDDSFLPVGPFPTDSEEVLPTFSELRKEHKKAKNIMSKQEAQEIGNLLQQLEVEDEVPISLEKGVESKKPVYPITQPPAELSMKKKFSGPVPNPVLQMQMPAVEGNQVPRKFGQQQPPPEVEPTKNTKNIPGAGGFSKKSGSTTASSAKPVITKHKVIIGSDSNSINIESPQLRWEQSYEEPGWDLHRPTPQYSQQKIKKGALVNKPGPSSLEIEQAAKMDAQLYYPYQPESKSMELVYKRDAHMQPAHSDFYQGYTESGHNYSGREYQIEHLPSEFDNKQMQVSINTSMNSKKNKRKDIAPVQYPNNHGRSSEVHDYYSDNQYSQRDYDQGADWDQQNFSPVGAPQIHTGGQEWYSEHFEDPMNYQEPGYWPQQNYQTPPTAYESSSAKSKQIHVEENRPLPKKHPVPPKGPGFREDPHHRADHGAYGPQEFAQMPSHVFPSKENSKVMDHHAKTPKSAQHHGGLITPVIGSLPSKQHNALGSSYPSKGSTQRLGVDVFKELTSAHRDDYIFDTFTEPKELKGPHPRW